MTACPPRDDRFSRRTVLAGLGVTALAATAGCSVALDAVGNQLLEHVNVFNETDGRVRGSVEVVGPADATLLDDDFELASSDDDESSVAVYREIWAEAGSCDVSVELDDVEIDGVSAASETVRIDSPDEDRLAIVLGAADLDAPIDFRVGEDFSDL
ncbi:hypothetical protein [Halosimplex sp. TS25]|uniref:hypothetical protein n=1 Tax=Halosimplex rarum TaxID=3396619 RepID=UPI0039EA73A5